MIPIKTIQECNSTNEEALRYCMLHKPLEPLIIRSIAQLKGRGQGNNIWSAEHGMNLTFSYIMPLGFLPFQHQFVLSQAMALACHAFVNNLLPLNLCSVKWPNDILLDQRKIAGILIENIITGTQWEYAIAGIGININQTVFLPDLPNATSLKCISGITYSLNDSMLLMTQYLSQSYSQLKAGEYNALNLQYHDHLFGFGQRLNWIAGDRRFTATHQGVSPQGKLLLRDDNGILMEFEVKEVCIDD